MPNKFFYFLTAVALSMSTLEAAAQDGIKIAAKPLSTEEYYTQVKLNAAKAYGQGLEFKRQGKFAEAAAAMQKSLNLRLYFVETDKDIPNLRTKVGEAWIAAGKKEAAIRVLSDSLGGYARWFGPGSQQSIQPLTLLGDVYMQSSDYQQAIRNYDHAYMLSNSKAPTSPETMKLRLKLAAANKSANSPERAASLYSECLEMQKKNEKLLSQQELITTLEDYASVLKQQNNQEKATEILQRVTELRAAPANNEVPAKDVTNSPSSIQK